MGPWVGHGERGGECGKGERNGEYRNREDNMWMRMGNMGRGEEGGSGGVG